MAHYRQSDMSVTLEQLNKASQPDFVRALGEIYENSPWVPERAYAMRPFRSAGALFDAMAAAVDEARLRGATVEAVHAYEPMPNAERSRAAEPGW